MTTKDPIEAAPSPERTPTVAIKNRKIHPALLLALAIPATATDTATRVCEISYGVINKYGNNYGSYAIIGTAGLGYLLYNLRFSKEGIEEIFDTPDKLKTFRKKPIAIAAAMVILPIALTEMAAFDGSTNFFFLDNIDDILHVNNTAFFQKTWRPASIVITILNVINFMVTEGVQGALKMLEHLKLVDKEHEETSAKSSYYSIAKKITSSSLGITGGSIEAAMALTTVVINYKLDTLGLRIGVAFLSLITLYVNNALRGKVIEETMDDIKDNFTTAIKNPASWVAAILSAGMAAVIAFSLQPLTIDMLNDGLDDLDLLTKNDSNIINYFILAISILNAINDFITFSNAFYGMGHKIIVEPYNKKFGPSRGYTSIV